MAEVKLRDVRCLPQDHTAVRSRIRIQPCPPDSKGLAAQGMMGTWQGTILDGGAAGEGESEQEGGHCRPSSRDLLT